MIINVDARIKYTIHMTYTLMSWIGSLFDTRQSQRFTLKRTSGLLHMKKTKRYNDLLINPCSLEWRWKMAYWNLPTIRNKLSVTRGIAQSGGRQLKRYKGRLIYKFWLMPPDLILLFVCIQTNLTRHTRDTGKKKEEKTIKKKCRSAPFYKAHKERNNK